VERDDAEREGHAMSSHRSRHGAAVAVVGAALAGFVAWSWPLVLSPSRDTIVYDGPLRVPGGDPAAWDLILANDQNLSLWGGAQNARAIARGDFAGLLDQGQCYPMPRATTLGEHMFDIGVLALPWWMLSHDPVFTYNAVLATMLAVAALGMFLFLSEAGAGGPAAAVGAMAFAFSAPRLLDLPIHPAVIGTHWLPWVLWAFERVLRRPSFGHALALGLTTTLAAMVGSYPLLVLVLVFGSYAATRLALLLRRGDGLRAAGTAALALVTPALATGALLLTYARTHAAWQIQPGASAKYLVSPSQFAPGGDATPGLVALVGLLLLVVMRRRDIAREAIAPLAAAASATLLLSSTLPGSDGSSWSLYEWMAAKVALLASVRAPGKVALGACFALQALGALGWGRALAGRSARATTFAVLLLVGLVAVEIRPPLFAEALLGRGTPTRLREVAPSPAALEALGAIDAVGSAEGAVLDLPEGRMVRAPRAVLEAAYHGHPTSTCYNSLIPATVPAVSALAARIHEARGVREAAAAGFRYVIERSRRENEAVGLDSVPAPARLLSVGPDFAVWELPLVVEPAAEDSLLEIAALRGASRSAPALPGMPGELTLSVTNRGIWTWAGARPVRAQRVLVELVREDGSATFRSEGVTVLPLALEPGATGTALVSMTTAPPAGRWRGTLAFDAPGLEVAVDDLVWE
jgi:MYXO-CTERM domain-containing protein